MQNSARGGVCAKKKKRGARPRFYFTLAQPQAILGAKHGELADARATGGLLQVLDHRLIVHTLHRAAEQRGCPTGDRDSQSGARSSPIAAANDFKFIRCQVTNCVPSFLSSHTIHWRHIANSCDTRVARSWPA